MSQRNEDFLYANAPLRPLLWSDLFTGKLPKRIGGDLREAILRHGEQEKLSRPTFRSSDRQLQSFLNGSKKPAMKKATEVIGSRLIRSWRGVRHEVMKVENGFVYRGSVYKSLSEIARLITGARWSGPRFFGLKVSE